MFQCYLDDYRLLEALCCFDEMDRITEAALFIMRIYYVIMYYIDVITSISHSSGFKRSLVYNSTVLVCYEKQE